MISNISKDDALVQSLVSQTKLNQTAAIELATIQIIDQESFEWCASTCKEVKAQYKVLDEREKLITKPIHQAHKEVIELFRPAKDALLAVERLLKQKAADYLMLVQAQRTEAMLASAPIPAPVDAVQGFSQREVQKWEVFDAEKVPRQFCSPDMSKIQAAVDTGDVSIPGIRFYTVVTTTVRSGK